MVEVPPPSPPRTSLTVASAPQTRASLWKATDCFVAPPVGIEARELVARRASAMGADRDKRSTRADVSFIVFDCYQRQRSEFSTDRLVTALTRTVPASKTPIGSLRKGKRGGRKFDGQTLPSLLRSPLHRLKLLFTFTGGRQQQSWSIE